MQKNKPLEKPGRKRNLRTKVAGVAKLLANAYEQDLVVFGVVRLRFHENVGGQVAVDEAVPLPFAVFVRADATLYVLLECRTVSLELLVGCFEDSTLPPEKRVAENHGVRVNEGPRKERVVCPKWVLHHVAAQGVSHTHGVAEDGQAVLKETVGHHATVRSTEVNLFVEVVTALAKSIEANQVF